MLMHKLKSLARRVAVSLGLRNPTVSSLSAGYDDQLVQVMRRHLTERSMCLDIGANAGEILEKMFRIAPLGCHRAFEPVPRLAAQLRAGATARSTTS